MVASLSLNFWGVRVSVSGDAEVCARLLRDFRRFVSTGDHADITLVATRSAPPPVRIPRVHVPRATGPIWDEGPVRHVVWPGVRVRLDYAREHAEAWSADPDRLHEALYLLLLSRVGERHDQRGLHRIHALGLEVAGRAVLVVLPSGTGKSTLGFGALRGGFARMLSDDMVLFDGAQVFGFPSRLGSVGVPDVDPAFVSPFPRMRHGLKYVVDADAFGAQILAGPVAPGAVIVGHRGRGPRCALREVPAAVVLPELLRSMVVGVGLPQVLEFFVRVDPADLRMKARTVRSRLHGARALAASSRTFYWRLGADRAANLAALEALCRGL